MAGGSPPSHALPSRSSPPPSDPSRRSSPPPSDPSLAQTEATLPVLPGGGETEDAGENQRRTTGSGEIWKQNLPYADQTQIDDALMAQIVGVKLEKDRSGAGHRDSPNSKKRKHKDGAVHREQPRQVCKEITRKSQKKVGISSPRVTTSPAVNMLMRTAAQKRTSITVRPGSSKKAKMAGSHYSPSQQSPISPSINDLSPAGSSQGRARRPRKLVSRIWEEVEPIYEGKKLVKGRCHHCDQIFPASRDSGSSHIGRHLKVCESKKAMNAMVDKMGRPEGIDPNWKFDPKVARRKLVKLIVVNELPFSLVEYAPFREFTASLNPWFPKISRTTIKEDCVTAFKSIGAEIKEYFKDCDSRVSLTGDMWTSNQKLGYLCLTCHFISDDWVLHKRIISFTMMETPHNSLNMFNVILESIQEWNLEDKLFSFTLDNASVNTAMVNQLRDNLKDKGFLPAKGKLLHFRCATHVVNLIVQDGLREIKNVVSNIRESVKFVKSSQARREKFLDTIRQVGLVSRYKLLSADVTTRWNSTYLMLDAAIPLKAAFYSLKKQDKDYAYSPLPSEWKMAEALCKLLEVFYTATTTLSGSTYPTSHLYFHQLWKIKKMLNREEASYDKKLLKKEVSAQDITIASMVKQMQLKFNQYWKESYKSACIPVILDPRFKYDLLEFLLVDFGSEEEAGIWMCKVKKRMQKLFNEYSEEFSVQSQIESTTNDGVEDGADPLAEWDQYMMTKRRKSSNELDRYLKEELLPRKEEVDILQWWKINASKYHVLSKMARDILAIPASTVPSESAFSTGGRVISDYRSSLMPSTVEVLICLQDWLKAADDSH